MKFHHPELGIWDDVEVMPELQIYATGNISAEIEIELLKDKEPITFETAVPTQYHMYKRVFEDAGFQALPKRKPWDHAIDLKPDATPQKLTKAYPISPLEDQILLHKKERQKTMTDPRLPSAKLRHCQKCIPTTTHFRPLLTIMRSQVLQQDGRPLGIQQHSHQRRRRTKSSLPHSLWIIRTNSHVLWPMQFPCNLPSLDE
jgi:hypothetical protein